MERASYWNPLNQPRNRGNQFIITKLFNPNSDHLQNLVRLLLAHSVWPGKYRQLINRNCQVNPIKSSTANSLRKYRCWKVVGTGTLNIQRASTRESKRVEEIFRVFWRSVKPVQVLKNTLVRAVFSKMKLKVLKAGPSILSIWRTPRNIYRTNLKVGVLVKITS